MTDTRTLTDSELLHDLGNRPQDTWTPIEITRLWGIGLRSLHSSEGGMYPTADAYEAVCKARTKWQERAESAERELKELREKL